MGTMSQHSARRPRLGLFIGEMEHGYSYQGLLWKAALRQARLQGVDLRIFAGHRIYREHQPIFSHSGIYHLAGPDLVDGLILTPTVLGLLDPPACRQLLAGLGNPVAVLVGMELAGYPAVTVDNRAGIRELMDHIGTAHGFRRIACLRGPEGNQEADIRWQEFLDGMARHGLAVDPQLMLQGDFTEYSGTQAMEELEARRGLDLDALVAANDQMALGALQYLQSRGKAVPEDVAVFGFDDIRMSRDNNPPLTTVRQPVEQQMAVAMQGLLDLLAGRPFAGAVLPTSLVLRESCDCAGGRGLQAGAGELYRRLVGLADRPGVADQSSTAGVFAGTPVGTPAAAAGAGATPGRAGFDPRRFKQDIQAVLAGSPSDPDTLNQVLEALQRLVRSGAPAGRPSDSLAGPADQPTGGNSTPGGATRQAGGDPDRSARLDLVLGQLGNASRFAVFNEVTSLYQAAERLNLMIRRFTVSDNLAGLQRQLFRELPAAGIPSFFVGYCPAPGPLPPDEAVHSFGIAAGRLYSGQDRPELLIADFPGSFHCLAARAAPNPDCPAGLQLQPAPDSPPPPGALADWWQALGPGSLVALPLIAADWCLGVVILSISETNALYCHSIQDILANILDRENRLQELIGRNLKERISHLAEERKMKSLNNLAVGIAHEVNTPVGVGITSGSYLERLLQQPADHSSEVTRKTLQDSLECTRLINRSFEKVRLLMTRFRDMALDTGDEGLVPLDLGLIVRTLVESYRPRFAPRGLELQVEGPAQLEILSRVDCISQVLASLVDNVGIHAYPAGGSGQALIRLGSRDNMVVLEVADQGAGMSADTLARIFEPYAFMRREGGGMGISMHIAWNMVVFKLKGSISCESGPGQGTRFTICLPQAGTVAAPGRG